MDQLKLLVQESLRDWFKKEKWVRIDTQGNIAGDCGTMPKGKATKIEKVAAIIISVSEFFIKYII